VKSAGVANTGGSPESSMVAADSTVSEIALNPTQAPEKRDAAQPHKPKSR
jgi:hypothetical protein